MQKTEQKIERRFHWINAAFITLSPPAALVLGIWSVYHSGFQWVDLFIFLSMYWLTGSMGISAGYHRYYAHRSFECNRVVQFFILIFGACALQNSLLEWASEHRYHHRHTDTELDPYNIKRGFFWAHMGWVYFKYAEPSTFANAKDLSKSGLVRWQHKYYIPIAFIVGYGLPALVGWFFGRPLEAMIWGGLIRTVAVHHATFLINSAAHTFGKRPHSEETTARDSWWLPFFSFGEGYHNYHHSYPSDYRNGVAWYHWDPNKWMIKTFSFFGWTWDLRKITAR